MGNLQLEPEEAVLLNNGDDEPMWQSDFTEERLSDPTEVFTVSFETGREWESEETEDGGFTIRTKPDPRMTVYDTDDGMVYAFAAATGDPMVYMAVLVSHDQHISAVERFVESLDDGYEGIVKITDIEAIDGYEHLADAAKSATDRLVPAT